MNVAVLGNGQLGAMLQQAGQRIGIDVHLLNIEHDQLPTADTLITAEREHWPINPFTEGLLRHQGWLNEAAFSVLPHRVRQKTLIDQLQLSTAPWCAVSAGMSQVELHQIVGPDIFLKRARGGYDGRGQQRLRQSSVSDSLAWNEDAIAEQAIPFETEVSLVGARGRDGQTVYYRLTENRHEDGILTLSLSRSCHLDTLQPKAEQMLGKVMQALDYVGVMAMECFVVKDELLINEIAPRVHNSGHWTQAGASISQFEMHLRAICGLPMPQPEQEGASMMINLLGVPYNPAWLKHGAAQLHWYRKSVQPGRKMGHLNFYHPTTKQLALWLSEVDIPAFESARAWGLSRLTPDVVTVL